MNDSNSKSMTDCSYSYTSAAYYSTEGSSAASELRQIYGHLSNAFGQKVSNFDDYMSLLNKVIKKYAKTQEKLEEAGETILSLNDKLNTFYNKSEIAAVQEEESRKVAEEALDKIKYYKSKFLKAQDEINNKNLTIKQLQKQLEEAKLTITQHEHKIEELNKQQESIKAPPAEKHDDNTTALKIFEELNQANQSTIKELSDHRIALVNQLHKYDNLYMGFEKLLVKAQKESQTLKEENEKLTATIKQIQEEHEDSIAKAHDSLPDYIKEQGIKTDNDFMINVIKSFEDQISELSKKVDKLNEELQARPLDTTNMVPLERYKALIAHLDDAVAFIRGFCSDDVEQAGADIRTIVLSQCTKISNFIEENLLEIGIEEIPREYSIFDARALDSPTKQMEEFLKFTTPEDLKTRPIQELFVVFCGIANLNSMLLKYNEKLKSQLDDALNKSVPVENFRKLNDDNFNLTQEKLSLQQTIENLETAIKQLTGKPDVCIEHVLDDIKMKTEVTETAFAALKKQNEDLITSMNDYKETTSKAIQDLTDTLNTCKETLDAEVKQHAEDVEKLNAEKKTQQNQLKFLGSELQIAKNALVDISKKLQDKSSKLKDAMKSQKETCSMLDAIQNRTNSLIKENDCLADKCLNLQQENIAIKEQLKAMSEVETKLRNSREKLKERVLASQKIIDEMTQEKVDTESAMNARVNAIIEHAKEESSNAIKENGALKDENEQLTKLLEIARNEAAKSKMIEKAAMMKVNLVQKTADDEKKVLAAKEKAYMQSVKSQADKQIAEISKELEQARILLVRLCGLPDTSTESIENLCGQLENKFTTYTAQRRISADGTPMTKSL